jgi:peptidoglycan/LPS O-acetylase OafA/YrhL
LFAASRTSAFDRELGGLSYPIYILHAPVLLVLGAFGMKAGSWAVTLSCLLAIPVVRYIDKPIDHWRQGKIRALLSNDVIKQGATGQ